MFKELFKKKNSLILVMIAIMIVLAVAGVFYGQFYVKNNATTFDKSGYIINVNPQAESAKYNFASGQEYKKSFNNTYEFLNTSGEAVTLENDSFLFYDDGSYSSMSRGVLLDIPEIATGNYINHYSIAPLMEVAERNGYEIENGEDPVVLNEVLWKTSESKFLVLSKSLKVYFSEEDIRDVEDFVEINYIDAGVVQLVTKDNVWQTVSEDAKIITEDGAVIYLVKEIVEFNEKQMLLSKLVLDSSENVELSPLEQKSQFIPEFDITGKDGEDGESGSSGNSGNNGEDGIKAENGLNGNLGGNGSDGEEGTDGEDGVDATIDSTFNTAIPQIVLESWKVDATSFDGRYRVEDPNNLLKEGTPLTIKVVESVTNQQIDVVDANGGKDFGINHQSEYPFVSNVTLKPDTEYKLVVSGKYVINGSEHSRDFLTKVFYTDSLGILIEKNPSETNSVSFRVTKKDYSVAAKATLYLLTEKQHLEGFDPVKNTYASQEVDLTQEVNDIMFMNDFESEKLKSNTKYYARLTVEVNENGTLKTYTSQQVVVTKTLKQTPVFTFSPVAISNRSDWLFELYGGNVSDPDKAVVSYVYEVKKAENGNEIVKNVNVLPSNLNSASPLYIDDVSIHPGVKYNFSVRAVYNDNEKDIEVVSNSSSDFIMEGSQLPAVRFISTKVTAETIQGDIVINLNNSKINVDSLVDKPITVAMICEGVYSKTLKYDSKDSIRVEGDLIYLPINESGLNQNRIYRFDVSAFVDYIGNGNNYEFTNIGHVVQATVPLTKIKATWSDVDDSSHAFAVGLKLEGVDVNFLDNYDSSILGLVQIGLYDTENRQVGYTAILKNEGDAFDSELKNQLVRDGIVITEDTFGLSSENLLQDVYNIKINSVYDYTANVDKTIVGDQSAKLIEYVNDYKLDDGVYEVKRTSTVPKLPVDPSNQIIVNPIVNSSADKYGQTKDDKLPDGAIIGYEITPNYNNAASLARKLHIYGFKNQDFDGQTEKIYKDGKLLESGDFISHKVIDVDMKLSSLPKIALFFGAGTDNSVYGQYVKYYDEKLTRGEIYEFAYAVEYAIEKDIKEPTMVYPYHTDEFSKFDPTVMANYVLRSPEIVAPKANPEFYMYTYDKNSTNAEFKYMYRDNDGSLKDRGTGQYKTNYRVNNVDAGEILLVNPYVENEKDYWGTIKTNSVNGNVNFEFDWVPYNDDEDNQFNVDLPVGDARKVKTTVNAVVPVTNTTTNNNYDNVNFDVNVVDGKNLVNVSIKTDNRDVLSSVVGIKMVFTSAGKTATYDLPFTVIENSYNIGLSKISSVVGTGQDIAVSATIYYDTGNEGWKYAEGDKTTYALQALNANRYLVYNVAAESNTLSESAAGSLYKTKEIHLSDITHLYTNNKFSTYPINGGTIKGLSFNVLAQQGSLLLQEATGSIESLEIVPKEVKSTTKNALNNIKVNEIIPSVQSYSYQPAMNYVVLDKLDVFGTNFIDNKTVTLEVYKGDAVYKTIEYPLVNCNNDGVCTLTDVTIDGLEPKTKYTLKMKGQVNGKVTHFINANSTDGVVWSFEIETSEKASLLDLKDPEFVYESYNKKYIEVGYGISQIKDLKIVYDILDTDGSVLLSSYDGSIRTDLTTIDYLPEKNFDRLYIDKSWFAKDDTGNAILEYGREYTLRFRLLRINDNGDYVMGEDGSPELMGDSIDRTIVFKPNSDPNIFDELWTTMDTEQGNNGKDEMRLNIKLNAINDPNRVIMTAPDNPDDDQVPGSYYYAYLYEKNGDEEEKLVATFTDVNNQANNNGALDINKSYQFSHKVKTAHTYLLRLYAAVDMNYDGVEDDYTELKNDSIVSLDEAVLKENLGSFVLYERDPYFTPDDTGISMGNQSLGASTNATNKIMVTYKDAVNINKISKVTYNIVNSTGALVSAGELMNDNPADNPLFVPRAGGYFTLELPYELKENGNYHVTISYEFKNDSGAYEVHSRFSDNYVY